MYFFLLKVYIPHTHGNRNVSQVIHVDTQPVTFLTLSIHAFTLPTSGVIAMYNKDNLGALESFTKRVADTAL